MNRGFLRRHHASLRTVCDPEGDAAARDGGGCPAGCGDFDGERRRGEGPGKPWGKTFALQDQQTQPETQSRILLSGRFLRSTQHPYRCPGPTASRCRRGEAQRAQEGRTGFQQKLLWPPTDPIVIECKK